MKINSRTIHFFDLEVNTLSLDENIPTPPQVTLNQLLPALIPHLSEGMEIKCGKTPIELTKFNWSKSNDELILLLNKADPDRSDVAYKRRNSKIRRLGNKTPDEDVEVSSHVLISIPANSTRAPMMLTVGAAIAPAKIVSLLNTIYTKAKKTPAIKHLRNIPMPTNVLASNGRARTYEVNHRFSFTAMPNGMLVDIINTGKVVGLNLIDTGSQAFDSSTRVKVDRIAMHIDLKSEQVSINFIKRILAIAKTERKLNVDQVRVEYTEQGDINNSIKQKTFASNRIEEAFTRSEAITLSQSHNDHQTEISQDIITQMRSLITT